MLTKAFINNNNVIELPGPYFEIINKSNIPMKFTKNLLTGLNNILPLINNYELKTFKDELRIKYKDTPEGIKDAVDKSPDWSLDSTKSLISFKLVDTI